MRKERIRLVMGWVALFVGALLLVPSIHNQDSQPHSTSARNAP